MLAGAQFVHLLAVGCRLDLEALFAEVAGEQIAQAGVVIDDQNVVVLFVHASKDKGLSARATRQMVTSFVPARPGNISLHLDALAAARRMDNDGI